MLETYFKWISVVPFFNVTNFKFVTKRQEIVVAAEFQAFVRALAATLEVVAFPPLEVVIWPNQFANSMYVLFSDYYLPP